MCVVVASSFVLLALFDTEKENIVILFLKRDFVFFFFITFYLFRCVHVEFIHTLESNELFESSIRPSPVPPRRHRHRRRRRVLVVVVDSRGGQGKHNLKVPPADTATTCLQKFVFSVPEYLFTIIRR